MNKIVEIITAFSSIPHMSQKFKCFFCHQWLFSCIYWGRPSLQKRKGVDLMDHTCGIVNERWDSCSPFRCYPPFWWALLSCLPGGWPSGPCVSFPSCPQQPKPEPCPRPCPEPCPRPCAGPRPEHPQHCSRTAFLLEVGLPPCSCVQGVTVAVDSLRWVCSDKLEVKLVVCVTYHDRCCRVHTLERCFLRQLCWNQPGLPELSVIGTPQYRQYGDCLQVRVCLGQQGTPPACR